MFPRRLLLPFGCALLLAHCVQVEHLPSEQVLRNAVLAGQNLQSASFDVEIGWATGTEQEGARVMAHLDGRMQDGGTQVTFEAEVSGKIEHENGPEQNFDLTGDVMTAGEEGRFLRLRSLQTDPPIPGLEGPAIEALQNQWWKLPQNDAATPLSARGDPYLLSLQTQAITVLKDLGIARIRGSNAYHYEVTLDPEKLDFLFQELKRRDADSVAAQQDTLAKLEWKGQVWIDASSFQVLRLEWDATSKDASEPLQAHVEMNVTDHDEAEPITPPANAADLPSSAEDLLPLLSGETVQQPASPTLTPEQQSDIINSLLNE